VSNGPDLNHLVMGHEGNFGIVTEAILRIRKIPEVKEYNSFVFHSFEIGIKFMDEVARQRIWPASMRVVDNEQFHFAYALKEQNDSKLHSIMDSFKKFYLTKVKGFDMDKICACTVVYEGSKFEVEN
jgi:alkyldihydroxyacetonephosphate synthase